MCGIRPFRMAAERRKGPFRGWETEGKRGGRKGKSGLGNGSGHGWTRPHGEKTAREKLEKDGLRGGLETFPAHRDGFPDFRRAGARRIRLETPRERRGRAAAAHLHPDSGPRALVHGGEVPGTLRGGPETLRRGSGTGKGIAGRNRAAPRGKQRQGEIQKQDEKEHPGGGKARPRPQTIPMCVPSVPHDPVSVRRFFRCGNTIHRPHGNCKGADAFFPSGPGFFEKTDGRGLKISGRGLYC